MASTVFVPLQIFVVARYVKMKVMWLSDAVGGCTGKEISRTYPNLCRREAFYLQCWHFGCQVDHRALAGCYQGILWSVVRRAENRKLSRNSSMQVL